MRGVSRASSGPGRCSTTVRSRPTSLPTPCSCSTMPRRYRSRHPTQWRSCSASSSAACSSPPSCCSRWRSIAYGMFGDPARARVLFHLDFGEACSHFGCPPVKEIWARSWQADVYLLIGGLVVGVTAGLAGAVFCATRPRSLATRAVETLGDGPLLDAGLPVRLRRAAAVRAELRRASRCRSSSTRIDYEAPLEDPWMFVRGDGGALDRGGGAVRRGRDAAHAGGDLDELDTDYVRTAEAKGLSRRRVIRRHAARPAYVSVASLVGVWVPTFVTNMVLVEYVFFVPGFFGQTKRALGQIPSCRPASTSRCCRGSRCGRRC